MCIRDSPYPNPSPQSAGLSKPVGINPIHTSGSTFNPALRYGAGTPEGSLVGEKASGATVNGGVGISEGRNWIMLRLDRPAVLSEFSLLPLSVGHLNADSSVAFALQGLSRSANFIVVSLVPLWTRPCMQARPRHR